MGPRHLLTNPNAAPASSNKGKVATMGAALTAIVIGVIVQVSTGLLGHMWHSINNGDRQPTSSINTDGPTTVPIKSNVQIQGSATDLGDRTLWWVNNPSSGPHYSLGQVTDHDGDWQATDYAIGSIGDPKGTKIIYTLYAASGACASWFRSIPKSIDRASEYGVIDKTCGKPLSTTLTIAEKPPNRLTPLLQ